MQIATSDTSNLNLMRDKNFTNQTCMFVFFFKKKRNYLNVVTKRGELSRCRSWHSITVTQLHRKKYWLLIWKRIEYSFLLDHDHSNPCIILQKSKFSNKIDFLYQLNNDPRSVTAMA